MTRQNLKAMDPAQMQDFVKAMGWPRFRADQIAQWIYRKGVSDIRHMTDLSRRDRANLAEQAYISRLDLIHATTSQDGTQKFLFALEDPHSIESVLIPDASPRAGEEGRRLTLCLSTQVGCTLDCSFCLTGRMGLKRNLAAHEIVDQFLRVQSILDSEGKDRRITHLVMMGMGEPLANYHPLITAIRRLSDPKGIALSQRRITVSTSGLVPQIRMLGALGLKVRLAVSLNATTDETRNRLMGTINRKYPIQELLRACRDYPLSPRSRLTFEYVLIRGINDSPQDAHRLVKLLGPLRCKVNLIPYNEYPGSEFRCPDEGDILRFQEILTRKGRDTFIRKSKGRDILAACGQLATWPTALEQAR